MSVEYTSQFELQPLEYQVEVRDYLKSAEPDIWQWYAENLFSKKKAESIQFELLKSTYRIEQASDEPLYATAKEIAATLSIEAPITIYQAQNPDGLNAALHFEPDAVNLVLHGPITSQLNDLELRSVLAHELSHYYLWNKWDREYFIVDEILKDLTLDERATDAHLESARLFTLYTEIFCDRGALVAVNDLHAVVNMLIKLHTNLDKVDAESYLRQAEEIYQSDTPRTQGVSHPELFIRARALKLWSNDQQRFITTIREMIEGNLQLEALDLIAQIKVSALTKRLLDSFFSHKLLQTELNRSHARLFFEEYKFPTADHEDLLLLKEMPTSDQRLVDYFCFILLDFVTADHDLEEVPLVIAIMLCQKLGIKSRFMEIAAKELRMRKKQLAKLDEMKEKVLAETEKEAAAK